MNFHTTSSELRLRRAKRSAAPCPAAPIAIFFHILRSAKVVSAHLVHDCSVSLRHTMPRLHCASLPLLTASPLPWARVLSVPCGALTASSTPAP
eukprot:3463928-Pleurochrysis_carterae.AAC.2